MIIQKSYTEMQAKEKNKVAAPLFLGLVIVANGFLYELS